MQATVAFLMAMSFEVVRLSKGFKIFELSSCTRYFEPFSANLMRLSRACKQTTWSGDCSSRIRVRTSDIPNAAGGSHCYDSL
ncbi:hypothetical protein BJ741DRAFT_590165, partial [Chytriomyces cf. hyalinus JEL632]